MADTAEQFAAKHTRREIEEMAEKLGLSTVGISKLKMAQAVTEARKKAPAVAKSRAKEAKAQAKPVRAIGKHGVFAMQADMESFASELLTSAMDMQKAGIMEMQKGINAQIKENEKGAAKMESGVKELHKGIAQMQDDIKKKSMEMHRGVAEIRKGIQEMGNSFVEFQNNIMMEYIKDFYYG